MRNRLQTTWTSVERTSASERQVERVYRGCRCLIPSKNCRRPPTDLRLLVVVFVLFLGRARRRSWSRRRRRPLLFADTLPIKSVLYNASRQSRQTASAIADLCLAHTALPNKDGCLIAVRRCDCEFRWRRRRQRARWTTSRQSKMSVSAE